MQEHARKFIVNKKRKSPLQLTLDDETEALFRKIAEEQVRDLSGQFKVIFREWLANQGRTSEIKSPVQVDGNTIIYPSPPIHILHGTKKEDGRATASKKKDEKV